MQTICHNRKLHIDLLRILAAFLVIYNHTPGCAYYQYHANDTYKLIACIALSVVTRINVPLFFALSGALLLKKEESYKDLFSKRIFRFCVVLIGASAVSYGATHFLYNHDLELRWFLFALITGQISSIYWFLYAYLGFLLSLPFLRKLADRLNHQDMILLVGFHLVFSSFGSVYRYFVTRMGLEPAMIHASFTLPFAMTDILFYPLLGYYLEHKVSVEKFGGKETAALVAVLLFGIGASTAMTYHEGIYWTGFSSNYLGLFSNVTVLSLFLLVKLACFRMRETKLYFHFGTVAAKLSALTLGIYLLDPIFRKAFAEQIIAPAGDSLYLVPFSLLYCCISIAACGTITWLLKKIPPIQKFL